MDQLSVQLEILEGSANVVIGKARKNFNDFIREIESSNPRLKLSIGNENFTDLDKLEKRAAETRKRFQEIAQVRLDGGQLGGLTKELVRAFERSQQLTRDIVNIKKELTNPNRKTSIAFLIDELRAAEKEANNLNRKLQTLRQPQNSIPSATSNSFGQDFGNRVFGSTFLSAGVGGLVGGAVVAGIGAATSAVLGLIGTIEDLSVQSIKLAGDFEATTNSLAIFAGGASQARNELDAVGRIALDTPGLRLVDAEKGYQRLRALNFEAKISQDLIKGLGIQRNLVGADAGAVDRVITNLVQLTSGAGTAADVRQTIGAIPSLRGVFQKAFGTADFGDINKLAKENPDQFLKKFASALSGAQTAQVGLNVSIEKGQDALINAGRVFGSPVLKPLTDDVQKLTKLLNENEKAVESWGQKSADAYRAVSSGIGQVAGDGGGRGVKVGRAALFTATYGASEGVFGLFDNLSKLGKLEREKEEAAIAAAIGKSGEISRGTNASGVQFTLDPITNTIKSIGEAVNNTPSLAKKLDAEEAAKETERLRKNYAELLDLNNQIRAAEINSNLELGRAVAVRDAKGDSLKLAKATAEIERAAINEQIALTKQAAADKLLNLSQADFDNGKGFLITKQRDAEIAKLENQKVINSINQTIKQQEAVEQGKSKVKELQKTYNELFDGIYSRANSNNPFVALYSEAERSLKSLRDNSGGLTADLISDFERIEKKSQSLKLFETRLENRLSVFDLRGDADSFRNPLDGEKQKREEEQFIQRFIFDNPNYLFLKLEEYNQRKLVNPLTVFPSFEEETRKDILSRGEFLIDSPKDRLNKSLEEKFNLLFKPGLSADEQSIADKKFISATSGANPLDLTDNLRREAAVVREREALRKENFNRESLQIEKEALAVQKKLLANSEKLNQIAESGGLKGVIELIDKTNGAAEFSRSPTNRDVQETYDLGFAGGTNF